MLLDASFWKINGARSKAQPDTTGILMIALWQNGSLGVLNEIKAAGRIYPPATFIYKQY